LKKIKKNLKHKFDLIINVAGGFQPHNLKNEEIVSITENMYNANMLTSILAANIAKTHMNNNGGLLVFTGAEGVKDNTGMGILAYQLAKHSVHNLTNILIENPQELPNVKKIVTLLP
jgi:NAD(P)-dependent dehydrogenase (short-subunit alcohol dehydrogenase family)